MKAFFIAAALGLSAAGCAATDDHGAGHKSASERKAAQTANANAKQQAAGHDGDAHTVDVTQEVPAFVVSAAELKRLPPTLPPDQFKGTQRLGYQAVREIPQTIAQLPCYCHCDKGFGHKSLHSCFVDDHAAHCAVCIDEALMAYKMEKEEKLSPEQIRQRIIAHYSAKQ